MRPKLHLGYHILLCLVTLVACTKEDAVLIDKDISVQEVKNHFDKLPQRGTNLREDNEPLPSAIDWNNSVYHEMSCGDVLLFGLNFEEKWAYRPTNDGPLAMLEKWSYAIAYKVDGEINIEVVRIMPTQAGINFTGYLFVENWYGETLRIFQYENDNFVSEYRLADPQENGRTDEYYCGWVTVGYVGHPAFGWTPKMEYMCVYVPEDQTMAGPGDYPTDGGGGGGSPGGGGDGSECFNGFEMGADGLCYKLECPEGLVLDENNNCVEPEQQTDLEKIMACEELSDAQLSQLDDVLAEYLNAEYLATCLNIQIFEFVVGENKKLCFKMGTVTGSPGEYHRSTGSIHFRDSDNINEEVFGEEFFHAYQDLFYNGLPSRPPYLGRSNVEFEAKLFHDLSHPNCCIAFWDGTIREEYENWLREISDWYSRMPTWTEMQENYYYFLEKFIEIKPEYNYPIDYSRKPDALLNIKTVSNEKIVFINSYLFECFLQCPRKKCKINRWA